MKSGAIKYVAAVNPKVVAAANQNADVSKNALTVALPVGTLCSSVDKFGSPKRDAPRRAVISYQLLVIGNGLVVCGLFIFYTNNR